MLTPLVIAVPEPMADALGYPENPIGWADVLQLARSDTAWADLGHPEFGPFRLGKTNPNFSTSGLSALIAQTYAATGKTENLTAEDLANPQVIDFATGVESAVVHYGDTTPTFLNNLYREDHSLALTYVSAVAVEEKSVIDYNLGNPDGVLEPGRSRGCRQHPARRDLPRGRDAVQRQPVLRAGRRVGHRRRGHAPAGSPSSSAARRTRSGCSSSGSGRPTSRSPSDR